MLKHCVLYKLADYSTENCEALKAKFLTMRGEIPEALEINVYIDSLRSERSYDVMLEIILNSMEDLEVYKAHPFHAEKVKPYVHSVIKSSVSIDANF